MFCMPIVSFGAPKGQYELYVNLEQNIVTVYELTESGEYVPIKAFICSVGDYTPEGTYGTMVKYEWRPLFGDSYGQYATRITGNILFHSVPYFKPDKSMLMYDAYNELGETVSQGCVRLTVEDAKWIYDNCEIGTTVKMYSSSEPETFEKPVAMKIDVENVKLRGWDPTDPDELNPWHYLEYEEEDTLLKKLSVMEKEYTVFRYDGQNYFQLSDIRLILKSMGKDFGYKESGNIAYIKANSDQAINYITTKKDTVESGRMALCYLNKCIQANIYEVNGIKYYLFSDIENLIK